MNTTGEWNKFASSQTNLEGTLIPLVDPYDQFEKMTSSLVSAVNVGILAREHAQNLIKHHLKQLGLDAPRPGKEVKK